ncbi:hypothetical protein [Vulcanisaeta moutnovskia]|nr:hypothetical protein [Vulcanisaeta moutnovskia]
MENEQNSTAGKSIVKLRKALTFWDLLFLSISGMVDSGWLFAASSKF